MAVIHCLPFDDSDDSDRVLVWYSMRHVEVSAGGDADLRQFVDNVLLQPQKFRCSASSPFELKDVYVERLDGEPVETFLAGGIRRRVESWRRRTGNLLSSDGCAEQGGDQIYALTALPEGEQISHGEFVVARIHNPGPDKLVFSAVLVAERL